MIITLPLPPSINATYKRSATSFYSSQEAHQYKKDAFLLLKKYKQTPRAGNVLVQFHFFFKDKRRDISSGLKILEDVLEGVCYLNDRQIHQEILIKDYDTTNPRVEIRVEQI